VAQPILAARPCKNIAQPSIPPAPKNRTGKNASATEPPARLTSPQPAYQNASGTIVRIRDQHRL